MSGEEFLLKRYTELHLSSEVQHTAKGVKDKTEAVHRYMERLERVQSRASKRHYEYLKKLFHKRYVISKSDMPNVSDNDKEAIIRAQEESLDRWLDYLLDENSMYPSWVKYWVFQGMLKIGTYNEQTETYQKRSKKTLSPFIEVNPEVLAKCIGMVTSYVEEKKLNDDDLDKLIESGNFQKIYTILIKQRQKELVENGKAEDGIWVVYRHETTSVAEEKRKKGIKPEYIRLYESLQGHNTGWCTAGDKNVAMTQVCGGGRYADGGDFYVYYTKDENGEYKVPRIAIRMSGEHIGEIRGVVDGQNLQEGLEEILEKQLKSISSLTEEEIDINLKKVSDMKMLTKLNKKIKNNEEFTLEELRFIYELDRKINGFGWNEDPRVKNIISKRNVSDDIKRFSREDLIIILQKDGYLLRDLDSEYKRDKEIVKAAMIGSLGNALKFADDSLKKDKEFLIDATNISINYPLLGIEYADPGLRRDKEFIIKLMESVYSFNIEYAASIILRNFISDDLLLDQDFLIKMLGFVDKLNESDKNSFIHKTLGEIFKKDIDNKKLIADKKFLLNVIKMYGQFGDVLSILVDNDNDLKNDREIVLASVSKNGMNLFEASLDLKKDREIVLAAVSNNGLALQYASFELRKDKKIALIAVQQDREALEFVDNSIKNSIIRKVNLINYLKQLKGSVVNGERKNKGNGR